MNARASWVPGAEADGFGLEALPYAATRDGRLVVGIGDYALDLAACAQAGLLDGLGASRSVWTQPSLDAFVALRPRVHRLVRRRLQALLSRGSKLRRRLEPLLEARRRLKLALPVRPGDFTDFYASWYHTERSMKVADPAAMPPPNWLSMPLGYHSRASAFLGPGARIRRPHGQAKTASGPAFGPSRAVDFELEVGFILGQGSAHGEPIPAAEFPRRVFGLALLNDGSARDLQTWESRPLGPFQAKSFASQLGGWVLPLEAVLPAGGHNDTQFNALPYLRHEARFTFDIELEAAIRTSDMRARRLAPETLVRSNLRHMYWDPAQMLAQLTANGGPTRASDVYGTGTVSGPALESSGCLLELTRGGREPLNLTSGEVRAWVQDGDEIVLSGRVRQGGRVTADLGRLSARLNPA